MSGLRWLSARRVIGIVLLAAGVYFLWGAVFSAGVVRAQPAMISCSERGAPAGALLSEAPEHWPTTKFWWWPLGLSCEWPAIDGGPRISVPPASWTLTICLWGGVPLTAAGILLTSMK